MGKSRVFFIVLIVFVLMGAQSAPTPEDLARAQLTAWAANDLSIPNNSVRMAAANVQLGGTAPNQRFCATLKTVDTNPAPNLFYNLKWSACNVDAMAAVLDVEKQATIRMNLRDFVNLKPASFDAVPK